MHNINEALKWEFNSWLDHTCK